MMALQPPRRILVVDDDRAMTKTLCDVLRLSGWEAVGAASGEEAVEEVERSRFTAVLMDVRMRGMSGVDTLRSIRQHHPRLPVILMTAYSNVTVLREAEDYGVTRVYLKPVPLPGVLDLLSVLAETRRGLLLVDDDPSFLHSLSAALGDSGYDVTGAGSLDAALAELRRRSPAVILLDLKLNDVDPREGLEAIRRASSDAAIIVFSGHPSLLDATLAGVRDARLVGRLVKPFAPDELTRILDAVLD